MKPAAQVAGWRVVVAADVFIRSQRQQGCMRAYLQAQCRANGVRFVGWRCAEAPALEMPAGCACSLRWVGEAHQAADAVLLVRPDLMWSQPLTLPAGLRGCDISMLWYKDQMQGRVYNDVCAFVANPEAVAVALEAAQEEKPYLKSMHNIHRWGLCVGTIVHGYFGGTVDENPFYKLIPLQSCGKGRKKINGK